MHMDMIWLVHNPFMDWFSHISAIIGCDAQVEPNQALSIHVYLS